jgi:hypothetical protein
MDDRKAAMQYRTISREDFLRDPEEALRRSEQESVVIVDAGGKPEAFLRVPSEDVD